MCKFQKTCNFPKLNQEESENLNIQITTSEIKAVIRKLPHTHTHTHKIASQVNLTNIQRGTNTSPSQTVPKMQEEGRLPSSF